MTALGRLGLDNTEYALLRAIAVFGAGTEYIQEITARMIRIRCRIRLMRATGIRSGFSDVKNSVQFKEYILVLTYGSSRML